jgi:hypothetical protein
VVVEVGLAALVEVAAGDAAVMVAAAATRAVMKKDFIFAEWKRFMRNVLDKAVIDAEM